MTGAAGGLVGGAAEEGGGGWWEESLEVGGEGRVRGELGGTVVFLLGWAQWGSGRAVRLC